MNDASQKNFATGEAKLNIPFRKYFLFHCVLGEAK